MEDCFLAKATERIFLPLLQQMQPEILDINMPLEGVFHDCCIVSIKKSYPMQARKVMHALWGMGQMMNVKMIIVVDAHVNVQDLGEVAWRVFNNIDAKHDLEIVEAARCTRSLLADGEVGRKARHRCDEDLAGRGPQPRVAG